jgi:hypothetical protein
MIGSTHPAILLQNERGEGRTGALTGNYVHVDVDVDLNLTADPSQVQNIFVTSVNGETTLGNLAC